MYSSEERYKILANSSMGLSELKILDAYVKKVNASNGRMLAVFKKNELEDLLGVGKINRAELEKRMECLLMQRVPVLGGSIEALKDTPLFERCELKRGTYGVWTCYLVATSLGLSSLFSEEEQQRAVERFDKARKLSSRYSYLLYRYLDDNAEMEELEVDLNELKAVMGCNKESYDNFKAFNHIILKKCREEIQRVTGLFYNYELIKYIRKVVGIRFIIHDAGQNEEFIEEEIKKISEKKHQEKLKFYCEACGEEFTDDEMEVVLSIISEISIPEHPNGEDIAKYNFLDERYKMFKLYANKKQDEGNPIKHRFEYFIKILQNFKKNQQQ